ncbi:MAG TPA: proton-conducting transporter membrane subunit [Holophagaceae bacterium]|nr:proton-conducting transporter membrane subunit [Holophagaceae bacterium]
MPEVAWLLLATGLWTSAALAILLPRIGDRVHVALALAAALAGLWGSLHALHAGVPSAWSFPWWGMAVRLEVDALSAAFLLPLQLVAGLACLYGTAYWPVDRTRGTGRGLRCFMALLAAGMTVVFLARNGLLFLAAWEVMATSAFFLVSTEHELPDVQRAGWVYLVCTHLGTLALVGMVSWLALRGGGLGWSPLAGPASPLDLGILLLALFGFSFKAGIFPFHFWLPAAHAGAPSHVSAMLSAVMLNSGIYGILRVGSLLPVNSGWVGGALLVAGAVTAVYGILHGLAQSDYKRLLAYSSIENMGIIYMGLGLGWTGRATGNPWLVSLGLGGALLHVWNHSAFKSLLFFGAGSVLHATDTRDMEKLGGLARLMPRTALCLFPAALAVAGLPPFNGFMSEWLLYRGLFHALMKGYPWMAGLALPALVLTGGLAAVAFAKAYGMVFLGQARGPAGAHAHDPAPGMLLPMGLLAILCAGLGVSAALLLPVLDRILACAAPELPPLLASSLGGDMRTLCWMAGILFALGLAALWLSSRWRVAVKAQAPTWDCGYAQPSVRMQYTGSSFSAGFERLLPGARVRMRRLMRPFPRPSRFREEVRDAWEDRALEPGLQGLAARLLRFRKLQPGYLSLYLLYMLVALLGTFLWMMGRSWVLG